MRLTDATYHENGRMIQIRRTDIDDLGSRHIEVCLDGGAWRHTFEMSLDREPADFQSALMVAQAVYGSLGRTGAKCTHSMVHDIWNAMRDIAGC